jgi:hypothetical protein
MLETPIYRHVLDIRARGSTCRLAECVECEHLHMPRPAPIFNWLNEDMKVHMDPKQYFLVSSPGSVILAGLSNGTRGCWLPEASAAFFRYSRGLL